MQENGMTLAEHKIEAIVFTNRWSKNNMRVICVFTVVEASKSIKYLRLKMDQKMNFVVHAKKTFNKVADI